LNIKSIALADFVLLALVFHWHLYHINKRVHPEAIMA